jgi:hypothetical protein
MQAPHQPVSVEMTNRYAVLASRTSAKGLASAEGLNVSQINTSFTRFGTTLGRCPRCRKNLGINICRPLIPFNFI